MMPRPAKRVWMKSGTKNLSESLMTSKMPWRMAAVMEVVMMVCRLRVASLLHPRLSSSSFSVSMASRMMWRSRERVGSSWQRSMRSKTLSSFWRRRSMNVRVYRKEAELKRVEDIVRGRLVRRKLIGFVASIRRLSEESLQVLSSFIALKNLGGILQIAFGFPCFV